MTINELSVNINPNDTTDGKLGVMAATVALQNFNYQCATILFFNSTLYFGVEMFLSVFNNNIIVSRGKFHPKFAKISQQFVLFGSDVTELEQLINSFKEMQVKNISKFIFVCESHVARDCDEIFMTELFWEFRITNVVFIKTENTEAVGYSYFPITDDDCNNVKPIKLYSSNCNKYPADYKQSFGRKFSNLHFCPLFVSTFLQFPHMSITNGTPSGPDGDLLRIIAYGLNTSVIMMTPYRGDGWGYRLKNGSWMGSLGDIQLDLANVSMTSPALTLTRVADFQASRWYHTVKLIWITHPAAFKNEALKLLYPFREKARIALIASYILVILCSFIVKTEKWTSMCREDDDNRPLRSVAFYSWMICMGQSLIKLPTKSALLQITILWIYFCFIIRTAYQVYLISSLKGKFYESPFGSIDDAIRANYPFGGGAAVQEYYIDNHMIYHNWVTIKTDDIIPTIFKIAKGKRFALALNLDTLKVVVKKHRIRLHIFPQEIIISPNAIFLKKYSPLAEPLNLILSRLSASGFPDKLLRNYTSSSTVVDDDNEEEALKIIHFAACYLVIVSGWILSTIFFLLEVYFGRIYKHPKVLP